MQEVTTRLLPGLLAAAAGYFSVDVLERVGVIRGHLALISDECYHNRLF